MSASMSRRLLMNCTKLLKCVISPLRNRYGTMSVEKRRYVDIELFGQVMLIGINRPQKKNAVNHVVAEQLVDAFMDFEHHENATAAVLYGKGGTFCAGYDLQEVSEKAGTMPSLLKESQGPMGPTRMDISKPVIAAIDGYAVAGGLELALMCDMRVVEESAIMGVYCRRFGVPLIDGGTVRLPAIIGLSRAMDMILTGRAITAKEALDWGLANRLVATGTSLGQAINLANSLIKFPQECLKMDKRSAYYATFDAKSIKDGLKFEFNNASHVINTESVAGAEKFTQGIGRHGKFRLDPDIVGE